MEKVNVPKELNEEQVQAIDGIAKDIFVYEDRVSYQTEHCITAEEIAAFAALGYMPKHVSFKDNTITWEKKERLHAEIKHKRRYLRILERVAELEQDKVSKVQE